MLPRSLINTFSLVYSKSDGVFCFHYSRMHIASDTYHIRMNVPMHPALCLSTLMPRQNPPSGQHFPLWICQVSTISILQSVLTRKVCCQLKSPCLYTATNNGLILMCCSDNSCNLQIHVALFPGSHSSHWRSGDRMGLWIYSRPPCLR